MLHLSFQSALLQRNALIGSPAVVSARIVSESLAGRTALLELETFSASEPHLTVDSDWTDILARGLFPELWRQPDLPAAEFYSADVATTSSGTSARSSTSRTSGTSNDFSGRAPRVRVSF